MTTTNAQTSIRTRVWNATDSENNLYAAYYTPKSGKNKGNRTELLFYGKQKVLVIWLKDTAILQEDTIYKRERIGTFWEGFSWINVSKEGNIKFPNGKKPIALIQRMMDLIETNNDYIVLDFFSGSATTAHAVMELNADDGGNRKYIMVELDENLDESYKKVTGEAKKTIKETIKFLNSIQKPHILTELGKERIRRAGEKIKQDNKDKEGIENLDIGFKVFRVADTNIRWTKEALEGGQLEYDESMLSNKDALDFVSGFKDIDVVYEVMLRQRDIPLSSKIEKLDYIGNRTYMFANSFVVSLEEKITEDMVEALAAIEPLPIKYIFRDSAFEDDIELKDTTFRKLQALIERNTGEKNRTYTVEFI